MTHYRLTDSTPSAIILARNPRTSSLDELKFYTGNNIFLNNGDEFQIKLFNPLREKIGVQIGFNGQISKGMLVLNPGEDVIVDRFIDDKRKMLFETYKYDKNNESAKNAVANNGIVEIKFFKEFIYTPPVITYGSFNGTFNMSGSHTNSSGYSTLTNTNGMSNYTTNISSNGNKGGKGGKNKGKQMNSTFTSIDNVNKNSRIYDEKTFLSCDLNFASESERGLDFSNFSDHIEERIETGRIEKGEQSDQDFKLIE